MKIKAADAEKTLLNKVIRFNKEVERHEIDFDVNMLGRIRAIKQDFDGVYELLVSYSEFEENNIPLMKANYYDRNGVPCETWQQQGNYEREKKNGTHIYVQFEDDRQGKVGELFEMPFDIAEPELQFFLPTLNETLNALERTLMALRVCQKNSNLPSEDFEADIEQGNAILKKANRNPILAL